MYRGLKTFRNIRPYIIFKNAQKTTLPESYKTLIKNIIGH